MKYNGIELEAFTSDKPVVFDPPKKMLVWDDSSIEPKECPVVAYAPNRIRFPVIADDCIYRHCAEIPEESKPGRAEARKSRSPDRDGPPHQRPYNLPPFQGRSVLRRRPCGPL